MNLEGHSEITVAVLDENEISEGEAALGIASEAACGAMEIRLAAGGRGNLFATQNCCLLLDKDLLRQLNSSGSVTIATMPNFSFAPKGQRLASVKTSPFAMPKQDYQRAFGLAKDKGPTLQAWPIEEPTVAVLYSDPREGDRARSLFAGIMKTRLGRSGGCDRPSDAEGGLRRGELLGARRTGQLALVELRR